MENAAVGDNVAKAASRGEIEAQSRRVVAAENTGSSRSANDNPNPSYVTSGSSVGVRSLRISTASALSAFEAAVASEISAAPPTDLQQLISNHLETSSKPSQHSADGAASTGLAPEQLEQAAPPEQQTVIGPDRGQVGGSGPQEFNSSLAGDGVASPEEVWAKSSWAKAHPQSKGSPDPGAGPIGYDAAHLAPAADRYATAKRAAFA